MNIVFDLDGTITNEIEYMLRYAPNYLKKKYDIDACVKNPNEYNLSDIFGLSEIFNDGTLSQEEIEKKCIKATNGFWNGSNYVRYMFYPLKKDVAKEINALKECGINIYFLTTRGKKTKEHEEKIDKFIRLKVVPFLTKMQLGINGIHYNQVKLVQNEEEKLEFIKKIKPAFVLDDQVSLLEKLPESAQPICVTAPHNIKSSAVDEMVRLDSYENKTLSSIIEKDSKRKIKQIKKCMNIKAHEKFFTESFYVLTRNLFKHIFINKFKPIVCGLENVPNDKRAVVYTANHRNNFDPLLATLFIDKPTHWAALLRLFEAKENLFGRNDIYLLRKLSSLLIKSMGCVPIARETDENYQKTNLKTMMMIDEYIKLGSSIGFYPEGTLNRKPEEQNLLPLASDAVFKIAKRNNAWVQPVATIWTPKDIDIPNKAVLIFPEAIETTGMNEKEIQNQWEESMNSSINRANEMFEEFRELENSETFDKQLKRSLIIQKFKP